jgi:hypothetical protein
MSRQAHVFVFLALLTGAMGLAAAGCGGDDRLTREELVEEADATCADFDQRIEEIDEPESPEDIEGYVQEIRPIVEEGTDELDALQPPEELEDDYDQWIQETRSATCSTSSRKRRPPGRSSASRRSSRVRARAERKRTGSPRSSASRNAVATTRLRPR